MFLSLAVISQSWSLAVGGDIMLNSIKPGESVFRGVQSWLKSADIASANLEIPLTTVRETTPRKSTDELKAKKQFVLSANPAQASFIANAGLTLVGLANNHAMDHGWAGVRQMTASLDKVGVHWCGVGPNAEQADRAVVVKTAGGVRVAFVSYLAFVTDQALWKCSMATADSPGVAGLSLGGVIKQPQMRRLKSIVAEARSEADVVVVWLHWGEERQNLPKPYQVQLGRAFVEAGADCVLGAHPHVLQGAEVYAGHPIFYSLGNFVSPMPGSTCLFRLHFDGKKFTGADALPCAIATGSVVPLPVKDRAKAVSTFKALGDTLLKRYRNRRSTTVALN